MVTNMQSKEYSESIQDQIQAEQDRKEQLTKRVKQLENQIDNLIQVYTKVLLTITKSYLENLPGQPWFVEG